MIGKQPKLSGLSTVHVKLLFYGNNVYSLCHIRTKDQWTNGRKILIDSGFRFRRIEISALQVLWNESGTQVCIATEDNLFILKYDAEAEAKGEEEQEEEEKNRLAMLISMGGMKIKC